MFQYRSHAGAVAIVASSFLFPVAAAAQTGLVAAYSVDEGTGTAVTDVSGNANTGSISGATWNSGGKFGNALLFNGSNTWVTIANSASLNLTTGMTLEAWIKPSALADWRCVILKEAPGTLSYALYASDTANHPSGYIKRTS